MCYNATLMFILIAQINYISIRTDSLGALLHSVMGRANDTEVDGPKRISTDGSALNGGD